MHREISHANQHFERESHLSLYLLTALLGILMALDLWPVVATWFADRGWTLPTWPQEMGGYRIALVAAILGGARVLFGSLESLLQGRLGADLALAIACVAAIFIREPLVAAEIVFIGMVGECLEAITFDRAQRAIQRIVEVFPRRCWLLRGGEEVRILVSELQIGDTIVVKPGAKVPVDGLVIEGRSAVDQSALSGESLPVEKGPGDQILAGSVNQFGALTIEAKTLAEQTVAGRVIELTARALRDKPKLERTADRLARYFLPVVLGLAALTFLAGLGIRWWSLRPDGSKLGYAAVISAVYPALAVLVVACPCPLILATPAAVIAALGRLAGTGIVIKGGAALERLAQIDAFAFDKTGTLTEGKLELGDIDGLGGVSEDEVLRIAAGAEQKSEHVWARLLGEEAARRSITLPGNDNFVARPGMGVVARGAAGVIVVGTHRLLREEGVPVSDEALTSLQQLEQSGQTTLLVARDGVVLGVIGARDRLRPIARSTIDGLRQCGIAHIAILSGDRAAVAQSIGEMLAIPEVHAELLPQQKAEFIQNWQREHRVVMVGDGINDAPALVSAHVGVAIGGTGSDLAAEAGDIIMMGDPLGQLPLLVRLSRETVRIIRQNIFVFAFGVNGLGILLTAWLWPIFTSGRLYEQSPLAAVIYHQIGSLAVLLNAMRLLWFERSSTGAVMKARQSLQKLDQWMEHHLDAHELWHVLEQRWRPLTWLAVLFLILVYAGSGVTQVSPAELAVVERFGRPVDELPPGLYWRWPWPIERIFRIEPDRIQTVEIGFRSSDRPGSNQAGFAWSSPHSGDVRRATEEAVMITGDGNLVELQATIRYVIDKPLAYLFQVRDVDTVIRAIAESVLRENVAGEPFLDLLSVDRDRFQAMALRRMQARALHYADLGVRLVGVSLHDMHPPQEVVPAYHDVTRAMEARDRQVNEAQASAISQKREAETAAMLMVRQAEAAAHETVTGAQAQQSAFLSRLEARGKLSWRQEWRLVWTAVLDVIGGQPPTLAQAEYERSRQDLLAPQTSLADFRLFWNALARALAGRDKIIIDADKVPGRRQLFLLDPEQFRMPAPVLSPPRRESTRREVP